MRVFLLLCVFSVLSPGLIMAEGGEVYYIHAPRAAVRSRPALGSQVLGELVRGRKFIGLLKGSWLKLSYEGNDGYVPEILASPHPPLERNDLTGRMERKEHFKTRIFSFPPESAVENGLGREPEGEARRNRPDYEALRGMESFVPSQKEIQEFTEGR